MFVAATLAALLLSQAAIFPVVQEAAQPSPPARVPPNASRITATVLDIRRVDAPAETGHQLRLHIHTVAPWKPDVDSRGEPDTRLWVACSEKLPPDLRNRRIEALLELVGDTRRVRWHITKVNVVP